MAESDHPTGANNHWPYTRRIGCRPQQNFGKPTFMETGLAPWAIAYDEWDDIKDHRDYILREDWLNAKRFVKDFDWFLRERGDWWEHNFVWLRHAAKVDEWWDAHAIKQAKTCTITDVNDVHEAHGGTRPYPETEAAQAEYARERRG